MNLQGVGHPISCLGVCYAVDPKKGGYTTPAPALDLTTSLRDDSPVPLVPTKPIVLYNHFGVCRGGGGSPPLGVRPWPGAAPMSETQQTQSPTSQPVQQAFAGGKRYR